MDDNLAKKYQYYQVKPEIHNQEKQAIKTNVKRKLTNKQIIARKREKLRKRKKQEFRKKLTLILMVISVIFGTLSFGLYAFWIQR